jgi:hypothetical protein
MNDSARKFLRIMERAYALRDARETERQKIVEEKYHQQWRTACDDVRALDSKALTQHMVSNNNSPHMPYFSS